MEDQLPDFPWAKEADWMLIEETARRDLRKELIAMDSADPLLDENDVESMVNDIIAKLRVGFDKSRIEPYVLPVPFESDFTLLGNPVLSEKIAIFIRERDAAIGLAFGNWLFRKSIDTMVEYAKYELRLFLLERSKAAWRE